MQAGYNNIKSVMNIWQRYVQYLFVVCTGSICGCVLCVSRRTIFRSSHQRCQRKGRKSCPFVCENYRVLGPMFQWLANLPTL